jgi:Transport protein particle (TRAPP) component
MMMTSMANGEQYLLYPCGVIRGALSSLGINATVQAETTDLPTAVFQIKTLTPKP